MMTTNNHNNILNGNVNFQNTGTSFQMNHDMNKYYAASVNLNAISHFFLKISRANTDILKYCPKSDYDKYIALGIILILMSVYNLFSFTHFFIMTGLSVVISFMISFLMAILILFIDQVFIASCINKPDDSISNKLKKNLMRLAFSLAISFIIPIPVKLMIFDDAIQKEYNRDKMLLADSLRNKKFTTPENEALYLSLKNEENENEIKIDKLTSRIDSLNKALEHPSCRYYYFDEYGNKKYGYTTKGKNIIQEMDHAKFERNSLQMEKDKISKGIDSLNNLLNQQTLTNRNYTDSVLNAHAFNFALKYKYFNKITGLNIGGESFNNVYFWFCLFISLFLGFLDFMPIFVKVFMFNGTYELIQYQDYQTRKIKMEHELVLLIEEKKNEVEKLLAEIRHKKLLDSMKKEHEIKMLNINQDYEKALLLMQTKDNLTEALYLLNKISEDLRQVFDDEFITEKSPVFSNK